MSTSKRGKSSYHHGDLRPALLRSAGELLEKQGPEGIVLREVARRAGVSHNAPYRHFPDRNALLAALAAEGFSRLAQAQQGSAGAEMGERYVAFALEHPQRFRLMFGGKVGLGNEPALRDAALKAYDALLAAFTARADVAEPEKAAAAAWSLVHGLAHLLLDGHFAHATNGGEESLAFVKQVMGVVRFAARPQRTA